MASRNDVVKKAYKEEGQHWDTAVGALLGLLEYQRQKILVAFNEGDAPQTLHAAHAMNRIALALAQLLE